MASYALAALGTGFTWLMTTLGASVVFLLRGPARPGLQRMGLGFASGVMMAACVWSLLVPAVNEATGPVWLPVAGGVAVGAGMLLFLDLAQGRTGQADPRHGAGLFVLAVALHNIPQGMAVGLSCALAAAQTGGVPWAGAVALALGIGLDNLPEGAAVSLPLYKAGFTRRQSFGWGVLSGAVEPVSALAAVALADAIGPLLPWLLSFAAGAMLYVLAGELLPETAGDGSHGGTVGFVAGFVLMMTVTLALG